MMDRAASLRDEIRRIRRVADQLCTSHAALRDAYARYALLLDLAILGISTWIAALVFVEPRINTRLTPFGLDPVLWVGFLAIGSFFLTLLQMKMDWRGRSDSHKRSFSGYAEIKKDCAVLLSLERELEAAECEAVINRYRAASEIGVEIPEGLFLRLKRRHLLKVAISRHLDTHPAASILLLRSRYWWRDNFTGGGKDAGKS